MGSGNFVEFREGARNSNFKSTAVISSNLLARIFGSIDTVITNFAVSSCEPAWTFATIVAWCLVVADSAVMTRPVTTTVVEIYDVQTETRRHGNKNSAHAEQRCRPVYLVLVLEYNSSMDSENLYLG